MDILLVDGISIYELIPLTFLVLMLIALTVGEAVFLRTKEWLSGAKATIYPLVTNLLNLPIAIFAPLIGAIAFVFFAYLVIGFIHFETKDSFPTFANGLMYVAGISQFVVPFLVTFISFVVVRLLTTAIIAKFPNLTWRYVFVNSATATAIVVCAFLIWTFVQPAYIDPTAVSDPSTTSDVPTY